MNLSEFSSNSAFQSGSEVSFDQLEKPRSYASLHVSKFLQNLVNRLAGSSEPSIREVIQVDGSTHWEIYDPHTQSKTTFASESEVRVWIEQRYSSTDF